MASVWLTGAGGMLAQELHDFLKSSGIPVLQTFHDTDITDLECLRAFAFSHEISFIVNCAAYTDVENAEGNQEEAFAVNSSGAENIALAARLLNVPLIHISTDYVFGKAPSGRTPINEDETTCPCNAYGMSKAEGEKRIQETLDDFYILRTSWLYGKKGRNFVRTMLSLMNSSVGKPLKVVNDQWGSPTSCRTLASVISQIITCRIEGRSVRNGIYHVTDTGGITWLDFAEGILALGKKYGLVENECKVIPCTSSEFPRKAERPSYSVLSTEKIRKELNIILPDWKASLEQFISCGADESFLP